MNSATTVGSAIVLAFLAPALAGAADPVQAKVTYAGTYGDGNAYVGVTVQISEPGCPIARFDVPAAKAKPILATAYLAIATGKDVVVRTSGCRGGYPTVDTPDAFFYIVN